MQTEQDRTREIPKRYAGKREGKAGGRYIPILRWIRSWIPVERCHDFPFHTDNAFPAVMTNPEF